MEKWVLPPPSLVSTIWSPVLPTSAGMSRRVPVSVAIRCNTSPAVSDCSIFLAFMTGMGQVRPVVSSSLSKVGIDVPREKYPELILLGRRRPEKHYRPCQNVMYRRCRFDGRYGARRET